MNSHTLEITELYKLAGTSIDINSASRTADTASLTFRLDDIEAAAPWAFGDEVTLTEHGVVVFHGYVTEVPDIAIEANGITCKSTLSNIIALLDATPYTEPQSFNGVVKNEARLISASAAISKVVSAGMVLPGGEAATSENYSVNFSSTIMCPTGSGSQTCWSLVSSCLHWVPNAVTWYNPQTRMLTFRSAESGENLTLDLTAGQMRRGNEILFTFAGYESASFKARHDLCPPVVGLSWEAYKKYKTFPNGGNLKQPWAFMFQVPERQGSPSNEPMPPAEQKRVQQAAQPKMVVLGRKIPDGWVSKGDMMEQAPGAPGLWHAFWSSFSAMRPLAKTNVSCLRYGKAVLEPVPLNDAFPPAENDEDTEQPENYHEFKDSDMSKSVYALYQGQFPASSKKRDNVNDLKFCKGKLKQYVWVQSQYTGELSKKEWQDFFAGTTKITKEVDGEMKQGSARYALLELECIFINRRKKKYQTGTNKLYEGDEDWKPDEQPEEDNETDMPGGASDEDYTAAAEDFYNATRKLYFDGSIALRGVTGYNPAQLAGANLSVIGARSEWNDMNTPVVQAEWNPQYETLTISTGSPEILSIDERIERTLLGRQSNYGAGTSFANPPSVTEWEDDNPEQPDEENESGFPMVSPSITASATVTKSGRPLNPFQIYSTGTVGNERWYINEGTMVAPGGKVVAFETTEITDLMAEFPNDKFTVRVERKKGTQEWEAVVRHYTPKKS